MDSKKHVFSIRDGKVSMKELTFVEPELKTFGKILKIREFIIIKETPHIILDVLDDITGDTFVCCNKADVK